MRNLTIFIDGVPNVIKQSWTWIPKVEYRHWPINHEPGKAEYINFHWLNVHINIDNEW